MKTKYKTFGYTPRSKFYYYVYQILEDEEYQLGEFRTMEQIAYHLNLKVDSLRSIFSRSKKNEIKHKGYIIYRKRNK